MTLDSIIERLEKAEGGDREIDAIIWATLEGMEVFEDGSTIYCEFPQGKRHYLGYIDPGKAQRNFSLAVGNEKVLKYTSSVDAAIALAEKVLPGWAWKVGTCCVSDDAWVTPDFNSPIHGERLKREFHDLMAGSVFDAGIDIDLRPSGRPAIALCIAVLTALKAQQEVSA